MKEIRRPVFILDPRLLVLSEKKLNEIQPFYVKKEFFKRKIIQMGRKNLMDYNLYKPHLVKQLLKGKSQVFCFEKAWNSNGRKENLTNETLHSFLLKQTINCQNSYQNDLVLR